MTSRAGNNERAGRGRDSGTILLDAMVSVFILSVAFTALLSGLALAARAGANTASRAEAVLSRSASSLERWYALPETP